MPCSMTTATYVRVRSAVICVGGTALLAGLLPTGVRAQFSPGDPSVLMPNRTYLVGGAGGGVGSIASFSTSVMGHAGTTSSGVLSIAYSVNYLHGDGQAYAFPAGAIGSYWFEVDGRVMFDHLPQHPGADVQWWWSDPDGLALHSVATSPGQSPWLMIASGALVGGSTSLLTGDYVLRSVCLAASGMAWSSREFDGVLTCSGTGQGTISGQERVVSAAGAVSLQPVSFAFAHTVAADGMLSALGGLGAVSGDGEMFFLVTRDTTLGAQGLWVGVKRGNVQDLHDLAGRLSISGQAFEPVGLTASSGLGAWTGEVDLQASSPDSGDARVIGTRQLRTLAGSTQQPLHGPTAVPVLRSGASEVTLADGELQWTLSFSANGRYWVGRQPGSAVSLLFGVRQAAPSRVLGLGVTSFSPGLSMRGYPRLGDPAWGMQVNRARGGAAGMLVFAAQSSPGLWWDFSELLWFDPQSVLATPGFVASGQAGVEAAGSAFHPVPLPNQPSLVGWNMAVQAIVLEPVRPSGLAMSRGLWIQIGP
jgi:hypothetical protein